ncbi:MAG: Small capsomere-interacting protein [Burkholderia sp.]|jgi:hypothetical protein
MADSKNAQQPAAATAQQGPFVHSLEFFLVGGQRFTINEISDSANPPRNVVAFINAWRAKKDVWHSPNNDPHFGVRVKDVSMYQYRVGRPGAPKQEGADGKAPAEHVVAPAAEPEKKDESAK